MRTAEPSLPSASEQSWFVGAFAPLSPVLALALFGGVHSFTAELFMNRSACSGRAKRKTWYHSCCQTTAGPYLDKDRPTLASAKLLVDVKVRANALLLDQRYPVRKTAFVSPFHPRLPMGHGTFFRS
jgi:hypothetical protein